MPCGPRSTRSRRTSTPGWPGEPPCAAPIPRDGGPLPWGGRIEQETRGTRMTLPPGGNSLRVRPDSGPNPALAHGFTFDPPAGRESQMIRFLADESEPEPDTDPGTVILTCANCGAPMDERKCKLICRCGYFLSCSDYS